MKLLLATLCTLIVGCQALGITKPLTFNEKLDAGYAACTSAVQSTDTLLNAGKLSSADAKNTEAQIANLKEALDIAKAVDATDATTAAGKLTAATTAIQAIITYLQSKGG